MADVKTVADSSAPPPYPARRSLGARLTNDLLAGVVIVGPLGLTLYLIWWLVNLVDAAIKTMLPAAWNPDTYLPVHVPGLGLIVGLVTLTAIGALATNLIGRSLIGFGEDLVARMPIVRRVYGPLKQIFQSVATAAAPGSAPQKVGLVEFPRKGLWSLAFVTAETTGEIAAARPGGADDLLTVWVPTGVMPPAGFIVFVPRRDVLFLEMTMEDAAKIILSGGMVMPEARAKALPPATAATGS
jgi:uncharacterized membrane protein